jgi:hypothetical protein
VTAQPGGQTKDEKAELLAAAKTLRQPAGCDPRFLTFESIAHHREDFVAAFHGGLKDLHRKAVQQIMSIEEARRAVHRGALPRDFFDYLDYLTLLWRRINDSIVWLITGQQRHVIKRLCSYKKKGPLLEANPDPILAFLSELNFEPSVIALWTDATSCVDIGDVLALDARARTLTFYEVKTGSVNAKIQEMTLEPGSVAEVVERIDAFTRQYGDAGLGQLERYLRQVERTRQVVEILEHEKGCDPFTQLPYVAAEFHTSDETYDGELQSVLDAARSDGRAIVRVDGCLWIYATHGTRVDPKADAEYFADQVFTSRPALQEWLREHAGHAGIPVEHLDKGIRLPASIPLFLRGIRAEDTVETLYGAFHGRVLLFLDWLGFDETVASAGATLTWGTKAQGRRERCKPAWQRRFLFGGRIPRVNRAGRTYSLTDPLMVRVLFDGLRPRALADQCIEMLERYPEWTEPD